jgi:hypothetical protein
MPVPSKGHYGFHSFPVADWFCLFIYLWVLTFPLLDCSEFGNFVITLILLLNNNRKIIKETFEDIKSIIKILKSMKDRKWYGKKKRDERTNNDLQDTTQKTKDWAMITPHKQGVDEIRCSGNIGCSCFTSNKSANSNILSHVYDWYFIWLSREV